MLGRIVHPPFKGIIGDVVEVQKDREQAGIAVLYAQVCIQVESVHLQGNGISFCIKRPSVTLVAGIGICCQDDFVLNVVFQVH